MVTRQAHQIVQTPARREAVRQNGGELETLMEKVELKAKARAKAKEKEREKVVRSQVLVTSSIQKDFEEGVTIADSPITAMVKIAVTAAMALELLQTLCYNQLLTEQKVGKARRNRRSVQISKNLTMAVTAAKRMMTRCTVCSQPVATVASPRTRARRNVTKGMVWYGSQHYRVHRIIVQYTQRDLSASIPMHPNQYPPTQPTLCPIC